MADTTTGTTMGVRARALVHMIHTATMKTGSICTTDNLRDFRSLPKTTRGQVPPLPSNDLQGTAYPPATLPNLRRQSPSGRRTILTLLEGGTTQAITAMTIILAMSKVEPLSLPRPHLHLCNLLLYLLYLGRDRTRMPPSLAPPLYLQLTLKRRS